MTLRIPFTPLLVSVLSFFLFTSASIAAPAGFSHETIASGFTRATAAAFLPDGRILVAEKTGEVKVVDNGTVLPAPLIDLPNVNSYGDRGLLGLAVDPNFADNNYIYLAYTYENNQADAAGPKTAQLIRLTVSDNSADYNSRVVLLGSIVGSPSQPSCDFFDTTADCIPSDSASHTVGSLRFSSEGHLLLSTGDGAGFFEVEDQALRSLNLDSLAGKLLRINTDGSAVARNPFYTGNASDNTSKVFAYGIRNSFKFNVRSANGSIYLGDVGWDTWEEVNVARGGENFGWPCREGLQPQSRYQCETTNYTDPIYTYPHATGQSSAIAGGTFAGDYYPIEFQGNYFFSDVVEGVIRRMIVDEFDTPTLTDEAFIPGADGPVEFITGPDGAVYYLSIFTGELRKIAYTDVNVPPEEPVEDIEHEGWFDFSLDGMVASFDASASVGPITEYTWSFGDGSTSNGIQTEHTYTEEGRKTVYLFTYDSDGRQHTASRSVTPSNTGSDPEPELEPDPVPQSDEMDGWFDFTVSNSSVSFDASPSSGPITRFEWNFGDGAAGTGTTVEHTYNQPGSKIVYLYSYDASGNRQASSRSVSVADVSDPEPNPTAPAPEYLSSTFLSSEFVVNTPIEVRMRARNFGGNAPYLTTVEFYNEQAEYMGGSTVINNSIATNGIDEIIFEWTPTEPGNYLMQFGYFSPDWGVEYGWEKDIVVPSVLNESGVPIDADPTHVATIHDGGNRPVFARPITISSTIRNDGYESPFIAGIEIYDENGEYIDSFYSEQLILANNETVTLDNEWFPSKAGVFTVHMGIFSPFWAKMYEWDPEIVTIEVFDRTPVE